MIMITNEILEHITGRAEHKASRHASNAVSMLSQEVQKGELTVTAPQGGTMTINASVIESLQVAVLNNCRERFQKEETELFLQDASDLIAEREKSDKGKKKAE